MGILLEALKGARTELAEARGAPERLARLAGIAGHLAAELAGTAALAPYGARALLTRAALPRSPGGQQRPGVALAEDIRYGPSPREVMDLYLPPPGAAPAPQGAGEGPGLPVVLFCHGGVWASGEKWHYAPMATALAQLGILVGVMTHTLYPQAQVPQMVGEVSRALTWTLAHAPAYGGDPAQVSVVGHSAGAHLLALALLQRAQRAQRGGEQGAGASPPASTAPDPEALQPRLFVGMAGCYNIGAHYRYERGRGVAHLSTMARAMGGPARFEGLSPALLLAGKGRGGGRAQGGGAAAGRPGAGSGATPLAAGQQAGGAGGLALGPTLTSATAPGGRGPAVSSSGHGKDPPGAAEGPTGKAAGAVPWGSRDYGPESPQGGASRLGEALRLPLCLLERVGRKGGQAGPLPLPFPPTILMSSPDDVTVPWHESAELFWSLQRAGVPAKHLVYPGLGHGAYVTQWRPAKGPGGQFLGEGTGGSRPPLAGFEGDLVQAVTRPGAADFAVVGA